MVASISREHNPHSGTPQKGHLIPGTPHIYLIFLIGCFENRKVKNATLKGGFLIKSSGGIQFES